MTDFKRVVSFEQARRQFVHRFTMEHVPGWSRNPMNDGQFYAPQFKTDREWYDAHRFPGDEGLSVREEHSESIAPETWPVGRYLSEPFSPEKAVPVSEVIISSADAEDFRLVLSGKLEPESIAKAQGNNFSQEFLDIMPSQEGLKTKIVDAFIYGNDKQPDMELSVFERAVLNAPEPEVKAKAPSPSPEI